MQRSVASAILLAAATSGAHAAVFTVSNINNDGPGSLRQAILDANADASSSHHIRFGDTFPPQGIVELYGALPAIERRVEINGMDRAPTIMPFDPSNSFPLLRTDSPLTLRGFSLMQGRASASGGCVAGEGIGAASALVVERMTFIGCTAVEVSGNEFARGGAISWPSTGPVTIRDSIFQGNAVASPSGGTAVGGAVYVAGPLLIESSYFIGNIANGGRLFGGAIATNLPVPGAIEITGSAFVDNHAQPETLPTAYGSGGALHLDCTTCTMRLERNFFGNNRSQNAGAALLRGNDGVGAADVVLHNTTFVGNTADAAGGAIWAIGTQMNVRHSTFHDNGADTGSHAAAFSSTISEWSNSVMGDVRDGAGTGCSIGAVATIAVGNFQHSSNGGCNASLPGITPLDDFGVLGVDDGELMPVVVFDSSSAVVDGGDDGRCLASDARGRSRPRDGNGDGIAGCDAGAFELSGAGIFADGFED